MLLPQWISTLATTTTHATTNASGPAGHRRDGSDDNRYRDDEAAGDRIARTRRPLARRRPWSRWTNLVIVRQDPVVNSDVRSPASGITPEEWSLQEDRGLARGGRNLGKRFGFLPRVIPTELASGLYQRRLHRQHTSTHQPFGREQACCPGTRSGNRPRRGTSTQCCRGTPQL
jgi:hypothetical protein